MYIYIFVHRTEKKENETQKVRKKKIEPQSGGKEQE